MVKCFFIELNPLILNMSLVRNRAWECVKKMMTNENMSLEKIEPIAIKHTKFNCCSDFSSYKDWTRLSLETQTWVREAYNKCYDQAISEIKIDDIIIGAKELLEDMREHEVKIILLSRSNKTIDILKKLRIKGNIDEVVKVDDSLSIDSEYFLDQVTHYSMLPSECVYISTEEKKIIEANTAGLYTVAIGTEDFVSSKSNLAYDYIDKVKYENLVYSFYSTNKDIEDEEI